MPPNDISPAASPSPVPPTRLRRVLRRALQLVLVLAVVIGAALAFLLRDLDGKARGALLDAATELDARIGRHVSIGAVQVSLGRTTEIVVRDIVVEAPAGAQGALAEPPLRVPAARLAVALGTLVRSKGATIDVTRFALEAPEITVVRTADGLSIDDIRAHIAAAPAAAPSTPRRITVQSLAIAGAKLRLLGALGEGGVASPGTELVIAVGGTDLHLDGAAPSRVSVDAATSTSGAGVTIAIDLAAPIDAGTGANLAVRRVEAHVQRLPLAPLLAFAHAGKSAGLDLAGAALGADLVVDLGPTMGVKGRIELDGAALAGDATPRKLSLAAEAAIDADAVAITAKDIELRVGEATLRGSVRAHGLAGSPVIDELDLAASVEAAALLSLLPAAQRPEHVALSGPIALSVRGSGSADEAHAAVKLEVAELHAVELDHDGHPASGKSIPLGAAAQIAFSRKGGAVHVTELDVHAGELGLRGGVDVLGVGSAPSLDAVSLDAAGPVDLLVAVAPPSRRPRGVALQGPFTASLVAHRDGAELDGRIKLDLAHTSIRAPVFSKPAGVPLVADLQGRAGAAGVKVTRGELRLGSLALSTRGSIASAEHLDFTFEERGAALAALLSLFPFAAERLGHGSGADKLDGRLAMKGKLQRAGGKTTFETIARLEDASIRRGLVSLVGAPELTVRVEAVKDTVSVHADLDLGPAAINVAPVFTKPAGRPARFAFGFTREGDHVRVHDASASMPGVSVDGLELASDPGHLHLGATTTSIALGPLLDAMPLLDTYLPSGSDRATARFGLDVDGDPDKLEGASLHLRSVELAGGFGHIRGSIDADGLPRPRALRFDVKSGDLELGGGAGGAAFELPEADAGALHVDGHVHLDSVRLRGETARAVDVDLSVDHAKILVKHLHAEIMGGTIDAEKSSLELTETPTFELHADLAGLDLSRLPAPRAMELRGRASGRVDLHGEGADWSAISHALRGTTKGTVRDLHAKSTVRPKVSIVNPILSALVKGAAAKHPDPVRELDLRELSASFDVAGGKLATSAPITLRSDAFDVSLRGKLGFDRSIALDGQVDIAPPTIARATDDKLRPVRPLPLHVKLSGEAGDIQVELLELAETLLALRGSLL